MNATDLINPKEKKSRSVQCKEAMAGYLFIFPTMLGFLIFILGPMLAAIILSCFSWDLLSPQESHFIGLTNFSRFFSDPRAAAVYLNTFFFVICEVGLFISIGLLVAMALNRTFHPIIQYSIKISYFFPYVTSTAVAAVIWSFLFGTDLGAVNYYLGLLGVNKIPWLTSTDWAKVSVIIVDVWKNIGFYSLMFLAGLQNIPAQLYEAANIDGVNGWQRFSKITLPLLSPTVFFLMIIGFINSFQIFDTPYMLTRGGPGDATRSVVMYIYEHGFSFYDMGFASAVGLTLFVIIIILTIIQFHFSKNWVHYR